MTLTSFGGQIYMPILQGTPSTFSVTLDANGEYVAFIIPIPKTGTLKKVGFRVNSVTTSDTINVRIETVDDTNGYPTGTLYVANATGSVESPSASTIYYVSINSTTGISVTKGDIIAVKFSLDYVDGKLSINTYCSGFGTGISSTYLPYIVTYLGGAYSKIAASTGLYILLEYDGEFVPFLGSTPLASNTTEAFNNTSNPTHRGLKITMPVTCQAIGAVAFVDLDAATDLVLYDTNGSTAIETIAAQDKDIRSGTSAGHIPFLFSQARTLTAGSTYRVVLRPASSSNVGIGTFTTTDDGSLCAIDLFDLGQNACYTSCNGTPSDTGSWTDSLTKRTQISLIINAYDVPVGGGRPAFGDRTGGKS